MPELPEVETTARGLAKIMVGGTIQAAQIRRADLRWPLPKGLEKKLQGQKITAITRRAKYMLIHLNDAQCWMIHLGMSGRMSIIEPSQYQNPQKHDHVLIQLSSGQHLAFNDPRRFGMMDLLANDQLPHHKLIKHLGAEPLEDDFNSDYLYTQLQRRKIAVKLAIMDQKLVVGVGNIYASEALYGASINPKRSANTITLAESKRLAQSIQKVLRKAIDAGGSSLRDYVQSDGTLGNFQEQFAVYGKAGQSCGKRGCKGIIQKITQGGRATFYCPKCQK